ncbi:MAG TPA: hypothetical protein VHD56_10025 [Tepidisphaeraceae bacterium]|nr:hypothetical protein [Tepidisphaeraceae bacterium]
MPYNLHIIRPNDFIELDARGKPDLAACRRGLERIAKACIDHNITCALLDVRAMHTDLGAVDFYNLVTSFHAMGFRSDHRLAILHAYNGGDKAEFFAACADTRGWNVRAFDSYEEALEWFSESSPVN